MPTYDVNEPLLMGQAKIAHQRAKTYVDAKIAALPTEQFVDQAHTTLVDSFAFNATNYAGATDPNLDGQPGLVLASKGIDNVTKAETLTYKFIALNSLITNKADKDSDAVAGNIAVFDSAGNPIDSGKTFATDAEVNAMLDEVYGAASASSGE